MAGRSVVALLLEWLAHSPVKGISQRHIAWGMTRICHLVALRSHLVGAEGENKNKHLCSNTVNVD